LHERVGKYAVENGVDMLICVGENARFMYEAAQKKKEEVRTDVRLHYFKTREELEQVIESLLEEKDTVLIKASHGMGFESLVKKLSL
ncbi:MAG: UDP-N-acetylmuramoyl-tripeptide--D-alanyl-D-alanine ligase, partial [Lachnospiraceae bacterium]|nr:UDP-N-acetylmuramoyl-tripeptide--D-alanyl-D-alanine ligase [Lachnospiraceae bacterium]